MRTRNSRRPYRHKRTSHAGSSEGRRGWKMQLETLEDRVLLASDINIPGALVERTDAGTGTIAVASEVDVFTVDLDGQQVVSVVAEGSSGLSPRIIVKASRKRSHRKRCRRRRRHCRGPIDTGQFERHLLHRNQR